MKVPMKQTAVHVLETLRQINPDRDTFTRGEIFAMGKEMGMTFGQFKDLISEEYKVGHGKYAFNLPEASTVEVSEVDTETKTVKSMKPTSAVESIDEDLEIFIPEKDDCYIAWGNSTDVVSIIKSKQFYPTFITGLSGNGKTMMVEQACAKTKREYIRVQITPETDEDDLLGGFRLVDGATVFSYGPVVKAMKRGAVLLIDEIDRGSNKLMCLQSVLEGKPLLLKKTGEVVRPAEGFTIFATANTKGKGSEDGRFTAATILDDAFLERFIDTMEQDYPPLNTERKIVMGHMEKYKKIDNEFAENLITWSEIIRKTFADGGVDEVITTRRLCHIVQIYSIFGDRLKAIRRGIARFDEDTKAAFSDLYTKVDASANSSSKASAAVSTVEDDKEIPF